jgi:hypothetical protein
MFFRINETNYFVIPDGKSATQIFEEIYGRMNVTFLSANDKNKMIASIARQLKERK